jgi:hypothetical protein
VRWFQSNSLAASPSTRSTVDDLRLRHGITGAAEVVEDDVSRPAREAAPESGPLPTRCVHLEVPPEPDHHPVAAWAVFVLVPSFG